MNTRPLADYLKAIDSYRQGKHASAEDFLAKSLGLPSLTPILKTGLRQACDPEHPNQAVVTLLIERMSHD